MQRRTGPNSAAQKAFIEDNGSNKTSDVLAVGDNISSQDMAAASISVGRASVLRIRVTGACFVAFSDDKAALDAATIDASYAASPVIELSAAGTYVLACPANFARASANPPRKELASA